MVYEKDHWCESRDIGEAQLLNQNYSKSQCSVGTLEQTIFQWIQGEPMLVDSLIDSLRAAVRSRVIVSSSLHCCHLHHSIWRSKIVMKDGPLFDLGCTERAYSSQAARTRPRKGNRSIRDRHRSPSHTLDEYCRRKIRHRLLLVDRRNTLNAQWCRPLTNLSVSKPSQIQLHEASVNAIRQSPTSMVAVVTLTHCSSQGVMSIPELKEL